MSSGQVLYEKRNFYVLTGGRELSIALLLLAFLILYMLKEAFRNDVIFSSLAFPDLPAGFHGLKIFFISDIHRRTVSDSVIEKIAGEADYIMIGGDLCEKGVKSEKIYKNLQKLSSVAPVFFVWGNNDYEFGRRLLEPILTACRIYILENSAVQLKRNGDALSVLGVDDPSLSRDKLELALKEATDDFCLLLSHSPEIISRLNDRNRKTIRLILSGHTHGGQIRFFRWGIGEKGGWKHGYHYSVLVSNGYGTTRLPLRLGAPAETHLIELRKTEKTACLNGKNGGKL